MQSRHDMETEPALQDNVQLQMSDLWRLLQSAGCDKDSSRVLFWGAYVYRMPSQVFRGINWLFNLPEYPRRVVRIPRPIWEARGRTFTRPKNYTERRDSDKRSLAGYLSAHRIQR
jgi:hypothetical protein